jgi:hypothetical protein
MPKLKTHRGAAKRFKKTASGNSSGEGLQEPHPDEEGAGPERGLAQPRPCPPRTRRVREMLPYA